MIIRPHHRSNARVKPIAVFDIETKGLGGDYIIGAYATTADRTVRVIVDLASFLRKVVLTKDGERFDWYAHNGAGYDYLYLVTPQIRAEFVREGYTFLPIMSNSKCHGLKITRGHRCWRLKDSYSLTNLSLKNLAATFATTQKLEMDHDNETFDIRNPEHARYLANDVTATLESVVAYQQLFIDTFNAPLGWTIAGTALSAWRQMLPPDEVFYTLTCEAERDLVLEAYYGGRGIVKGSHVWANVHSYDVNSMYAHAMTMGVPSGQSCYTREYHAGEPGFYRVVAHSNSSDIPALPKRDPSRKGLVYYPLGDFETTVTSLEIDFATSIGWTIDVLEGYVFDEIAHPFDEFIKRCHDLRMLDYNGPLGILAKNVQNHLYGKLAQSPEREMYRVQAAQPEPNTNGEWLPDIVPYRRHIKDIWTQTATRKDAIYMPHWSAWITSQARVFVMQAAMREGWDRVVYSDTDSLWLLGEAQHLDVGDEYGQWKHEHGPTSLMVLAPKTYLAVGEDETIIRCKGIPRQHVTVELMAAAFNGESRPIDVTVINGMLAVMRGYGISWQQARTITTPSNVEGYHFDKPSRQFLPPRLTRESPIDDAYERTAVAALVTGVK